MFLAISGPWGWSRKTEGEYPPSSLLSIFVITGNLVNILICALEPVEYGRFLFVPSVQSDTDSVTRTLAVIGSFLSGFGSSREI